MRLSDADRQTAVNVALKITTHRPNHETYATQYCRNAWEDDALVNNYTAICAEIAVARMLDRPWNGGGLEAGTADVGTRTEVRHAKERHYGLVIKQKDVQNDFVNVLCYVFDDSWNGFRSGDVEVLGYCDAREGYLMAGECQREHCCYILNKHTRALGQRHLNRFHKWERRTNDT